MYERRRGQRWLGGLAHLLVFAGLALSGGPALAGENTRVLVLEPTGDQVEPQTRKTIAQLLSVELQSISGFDVITRDDVQKMMELEAEKQAAGCDDSSCLAELAGAMGAELVIFGDVGKLGSVMILTFNLFDSAAAKSTNRVNMKVKGLEEIPDKIPGVVKQLLQGVQHGGDGSAAAPAPAPPKTEKPAASPAAKSDAEPADSAPQAQQASAAPASGGSAMASVWRWGLVGVGGSLITAGFLFDAASPTSADQQLDAFDFMWVYTGVVGGGMAALGLLFNPFASDAPSEEG